MMVKVVEKYFLPFLAVAALLFATISALNFHANKKVSAQSVASVNGHAIPMAEYLRALNAMQSSLKRPLNESDKQHALTQLIREELLVQTGIELDLARDDRLIRKNITQAMISSITSLELDPSEEELRAFYNQHQKLFTHQRHLSVDVAFVDTKAAGDKFQHSIKSGQNFRNAKAAQNLSGPQVPPMTPHLKIADYIGGAARDQLVRMAKGDIAGPIAFQDGEIFIWLYDESGGEQMEFETARDAVALEMLRRRDDAALERYLRGLEQQADIEILQDVSAMHFELDLLKAKSE